MMRYIQQRLDNDDTNERRPLLPSRTPSTWSIAISTLGLYQGNPSFEEITACIQADKLEEEKEARWFAELKRRPWRNRPSNLWIGLWLMLFGLMLGMCSVPLERLKAEVICADILSDPKNSLYPGQGNFDNLAINGGRDPCQTETVLAVIHLLEGRIRTMTGIGTKWCSISDVYGRKLLLHVGLAGIATCVMIGWFAASRYNQFGPNVYYLEVVALTLMPAGQVINTAIFAYIADVTEKQNRSLMCGYLVTSMALGGLIGSTIGTYLSTVTGDPTVPLRITLILIALLAVYLSILPESLRYTPVPLPCISTSSDDASDRGVPDSIATSPWAIWSFLNLAKEATCMIFDPVLHILPGRVPKSAYMTMSATPAIILLVHVLTVTASYGANSLLSSMAKLVLHWNIYEDGHYPAFVQLCMFITFFGIFPALLSIYKLVVMYCDETEEPYGSNDSSWSQETLLHHNSDQALAGIGAVKMDMFFIIVGLCIMIVGLLIVPIFPSIPVLYLAGAINSLGVISSVSCVAVMSSIVPSDMIGAAYGAYSVSESLGGVIADFTFGLLFVKTMKTSPIFYYYVSAGLCIVALFAQLINWSSYRRK